MADYDVVQSVCDLALMILCVCSSSYEVCGVCEFLDLFDFEIFLLMILCVCSSFFYAMCGVCEFPDLFDFEIFL